MSLLPLLLLVAVLAADAGLGIGLFDAGPDPRLTLSIQLGVNAVIVAAMATVCAVAARRVGTGRTLWSQVAFRMRPMANRLVVMNAVVGLLLLDWLGVVRAGVGDLILLDELLVLAPALGSLFLLWLSWYPLERVMSLGGPQYEPRPGPPVGAWAFAGSNFAMQTLFLWPALLIVAVIDLLASVDQPWLGGTARDLVLLAAAATVFVMAPLLLRMLLPVKPLEPGDLRDRLESISVAHRVGLRAILKWDPPTSRYNAAVIGLVAPIRYVLITRMLIETLPERFVEAVMAHEIGHVRCRHMIWLLLTIVAIGLAMESLLRWLPQVSGDRAADELLALGLLVVVIWIGLGWVSRRLEWQADAFAVCHLSRTGPPENPVTGLVTLEAVTTMTNALTAIGTLNGHGAPVSGDGRRGRSRRSWRHGSTSLRCHRLGELVGRPLQSLPIDTVVTRLKLALLAVTAIAVATLIWLDPPLTP